LTVQLPLAFKSSADQRFVDYLGNESARASLEQAADAGLEHNIFLAGPQGSGKTHLLRAAVSHGLALGRSAAYVPLARMAPMLPDMLEGFERHDVICLDDVQAVAGSAEAEVAMFHFFNRAKEAGARLVFSASGMPASLSIQLPDLVSRLEQSVRFTLDVLDETGKRQVLLLRARQRGLELDEAAMDYLFTRVSRDLHALSRILDRLDHASLAAQRRLTVPFIKTVLNP
jgi:DnaA family protein